MAILTKEQRLLTLSLLLRSLPKEQQSILMSHFSPDVARELRRIEMESGSNTTNIDWAPMYQSFPQLKKVLNDCVSEIRQQKLERFAEEQRPIIRQYILMKLGKNIKSAPVFISEEIKETIDRYMASC